MSSGEGMEEEKEQGRGVWRLDCGAMVGWVARSQVAGGPKDADCCCWFCPVRRLMQQFIVLPVLFCLHVAVVHVSRLVLLVYYSVECHQGSMCCRMTIVVRVMTFPKLSCA